jgi:hypothetical protein
MNLKLVSIAAMVAGSALSGLGQTFVPGCKLQFEAIAQAHPIDATCIKEGLATGAMALQNAVKNNFCASDPPIPLKFGDFDALQKIAAEKAVPMGPGRVPADRTALRHIVDIGSSKGVGEGSLVRLAAFVDSVRNSGPESANCRLLGAENNDIHVNLVENPGDDLCNSVTAEISPHFRPVVWAHLAQMAVTRPVRITGQLFFDADHRPCEGGQRSGPHPKRRSTWEIHPVYGIDICNYNTAARCTVDDEQAWAPLDQWKNEESAPNKLGITISPSIVHPRTDVKVQISLLNSANEPAPLKQDIAVTLTIKAESSSYRDQRALTVPAGQAWASVIIQVPSAGIYSLEATTPQLRPSSSFLNVVGGERASEQLPQATLLRASFHLPNIVFAAPPPQSPHHERVMILMSPEREIMADGLDTATVSALTDGDVAHEDISISLHASLGFFACASLDKSNPCADYQLVVPKGFTHAEARLTSKQVGKSTIAAVPGTPTVELAASSVQVEFGPPITKISAVASPPDITLVGRSQLIVRLTDDQGTIYVPSRPRRIFLSITKGEGHLDPEGEAVILEPPNHSAEISFVPGFGVGETDLTASTDQLKSVELQVRTRLPIALILIAIAGGLVGGAIYISVHRRAKRARIAIGAVTGFILYWAVVFGVIATKTSFLVLSPLSDFAISVIGGWLGTEVFSLVLKRIGVSA